MPDFNNENNIDIEIPKNPKRRMSKRRKELLVSHYVAAANIVLIALIFIAGFIYLTFLDRETVSNEENRNLAKLPKFTLSSYFSGEFTEGLADYYDDTVPNRSEIKKFIASSLLPLKGRQYGEDEITIYGSGFENNNDSEEPETPVTEPPTTEPVTDEPAVTSQPESTTSAAVSTAAVTTTTVTTLPDNNNAAADGEIANNIVVANNRGLMLFGGSKSNGLEYASFVNAYKEALGDSVNVYSMVCPTAVSYYMPENFLDLTSSEKDNIDNINSALVNVTPVNAYDALLLHKNENIYARTDHHWQALGAYYAAQEFAKTADVPFAELSEYEEVSLPGYVGTLYGYTKSAALIDNPEDFVYYIPKTDTVTTRYSTTFTEPRGDSLLLDPGPMSNSNYYMVFGGDGQITHVATECKNGRTLVIFKDSYGNALLPALTSSFENIYLCDVRYFDLNAVSFIQQVGATDLLFAMNTFSATGQNHEFIEANRTK
ncbi:MAG: hypothetical protein IJX77_01200 [Ruminococcus sp.]|nr:hypothetical protein [Ruminococcus sp.]